MASIGLILAARTAGTSAARIRWIEPLLFQQSPRDPLIYASVGAIMLLVALAASASPAARAARADPNAALRAE